MTSNRTHLSRRDARRVLDGAATHPDPELTELAELAGLLAAAARPTGTELADEEVAVAQFTAAVTGRPVTVSEGSPMSKLTRRIVAAPVATLGVAGAALATGGIAFAASQGALHAPFTGHDHRSPNAPAASATVNPGLSGTARDTAGSDPTEAPDPTDTPTDTATPSASPSPSLVGLCHAYQAGAGAHNGMTNPAFTALTNAAGGAGNVATYCAALVPPKAHPTQAANPTHPAHAAHPAHPARPTQAASPTHPAQPTHPARPTQAASPTHPARPSQAATPNAHAAGHGH